jgi:UPF0716 protein FxsA
MIALVLFVVWPLLELFVAIRVGDAIGVLPTLLLLAAGWPVGVWVLRSQGRLAWRRLRAAIAEGRPPGREVLDGALIVLGGGLLIVPGFVSDVIALALLLAPTRAVLRLALVRNFQSRFVVGAARMAGRPDEADRPYDVDSTARDLDPPTLRP